MNLIQQHLDKDHLHHAYLIEGEREKVLPQILEFLQATGIQTAGNPDLIHLHLDSFKINDARSLRSHGTEKGFSSGKKIFIISANSFLLEAQNMLFKMFEEPIENTHFFLVVPDSNALLRTLVSRFYLISAKAGENIEAKMSEKFIRMPLKDRIDFLKELLAETEEEDEEGNEIIALESARSKALKFLNQLEVVLHKNLGAKLPFGSLAPKLSKMPFDTGVFDHFFKVRKFLRMPGSSVKSLMESVALTLPMLY